MITYEMRIESSDGMVKKTYVQAENYHEAVKKMKEQHGKKWIVRESKPVFAE